MLSHTTSLERIEVQSNKNISLNVANTSILESIKTGTNQIHDSIHASDQKLDSLNDKVQNLAQNLPQNHTGLSSDDWTALKEIIGLMKNQYHPTNESAANAVSHEAMTNFNDLRIGEKRHSSNDDNLLDDSLQDAYHRLFHLAKEREKTVMSAEAASVISDIQQVLVSILGAEQVDRSVQNKSKRRRISYENNSDDDQDLRFDDEAKQIKDMLDVSHIVAINKKGSYTCCIIL